MTIETKLTTISRLEEARARLVEAIGEPEPNELSQRRLNGECGWSARDALCHIAALDEMAAADVQRAKVGAVPLLSTWKLEDADVWNAFFVNTRANCSELQILEELFSLRYRLMGELATAPVALFEQGQFVRTLCELVAGHDEHHAAELKAASA